MDTMDNLWIILGILATLGAAFLLFWWVFRLRWNNERSMSMVFMKLQIPRKESKEDKEREKEKFSGTSDFKEPVGIMKHFFESLHGLKESG